MDLFIVISGFSLTLMVDRHRKQVDAVPFWERRALRLLPAYYVALALAAVLALSPATWSAVATQQATAGDLLAYALLVQTLVPDAVASINGSLWSVALEAHLYVLFPAFLWLWRRLRMPVLLAAAAALSIAWGLLAEVAPAPLGSDLLLPSRLVQFVAGMACAALYRSGKVPSRTVIWSMLVLGGLAAVAVSTARIPAIAEVAWAIPSAAAVLLAVRAMTDGRARPFSRTLARLGLISYSFYLLHQPIVLLLADPVQSLTSNPVALLAIGCTAGTAIVVGAAMILYVTVERPTHRLGRRRFRRVVPPTAG